MLFHDDKTGQTTYGNWKISLLHKVLISILHVDNKRINIVISCNVTMLLIRLSSSSSSSSLSSPFVIF